AHVVVRAAVEPRHPFVDRVLGRQDQHGKLGLAGANIPQDLESRSPGQHQIEHHYVIVDRAGLLPRVGAFVQDVDCVPFLLQAALNEAGDFEIVFDDKDTHQVRPTYQDLQTRAPLKEINTALTSL